MGALVALLSAIGLALSGSQFLLPAARTPDSGAACASRELAAVADRVVASFEDHQFVFIGSTHGGRKTHDFLLCLLSRPRFQRRVADVLVGFASPVHQVLIPERP
ncbi:MAG TPA: hypothetical protein VGK70_05765 [Thermoanaerobaculia bacterium]|jgi:hypothetical protein